MKRPAAQIILMDVVNEDTALFSFHDLHAGANNYLKKPFRPKMLSQLIQKYYHITKSRAATREIKKMVVNKEFELRFRSDIEIIPKIVDYIIHESNSFDI